MVAIAGKEGCPCIDNAATLASLDERHCLLPDGETTGIQLTIGGSCVPFSYGSSSCRQHDLLHDPACNTGRLLRPGEVDLLPGYCVEAWCYVDAKTCQRESEERVYRSGYFPIELDVDVFWSYSTCDSKEDAWLKVKDEILGNDNVLGGVGVVAKIPTYQVPDMYKRDGGGKILSSWGDEYYDDSVPFEGVYVDYVKKIMDASEGDIRNVTFTHRSKVSGLIHPSSSFTAAVQDVQDGLADMAVGPFWITSQRLKMTAFTIPIVDDRTFLVIPKPEVKDTLYDQVQKVLRPFSLGLWGLILGIIAFTSLLSVWFGEKRTPQSSPRSTGWSRRRFMRVSRWRERRRPSAYARLCLDSCLRQGMFFCSAGVEQDDAASLPYKLLLFGFGFFILISVSAYVANLAAFLTLSGVADTVKTMGEAVARGYTICAHPALRTELELAWPDAKFYYKTAGSGFFAVLDDYEAGKCKVMAIGYEDTSMDAKFLERMCTMGLVYTDSVIVETPIAFPIRPGLAAGFSYWMHQGERQGVTLQASKDQFVQGDGCTVHFSAEDYEGSEYDETAVLTAKNMFFPTVFFAVCAALAVILQIVHLRSAKNGRGDLLGRQSALHLTAEYEPHPLNSRRPRRKRMTSLVRRRHGQDHGHKKDDDYDGSKGDEESPENRCSTQPLMSGQAEARANECISDDCPLIPPDATLGGHRIPSNSGSNGSTSSVEDTGRTGTATPSHGDTTGHGGVEKNFSDPPQDGVDRNGWHVSFSDAAYSN